MRRRRIYLLSSLVIILLIIWLINTPPGLLGKTDAVAYAVCHRISSHSFYLAERPFSLCARCSGQYLGFLFGFVFQAVVAKRRFGFPRRNILILMGVLLVLYVIDGLNSLFHLYPGFEHLHIYQPSNILRLFSGLGVGLAISTLLYPLSGQSIWKDYSLGPSIKGYSEWVLVIVGLILTGGLVLTGNPLILYPMILLSTIGLVFLLSLLYGMIWLLILKKENSITAWRELLPWGLAGLSSALIQIMIVDAVRYFLTGTWSGFLDY